MICSRLAGSIAVFILSGARLSGQGVPSAMLHGQAYDSLIRGPLTGATVWLRDMNRSAITDAKGRFTIDSVPPGTHVVILSDQELEDVGIPEIASAITLGAGESREITLATPSIVTLWHRLCPTGSPGRDSAIVFGTVKDADSDSLLSGATVTGTWMGFAPRDSQSVRIVERTAASVTDSTGSYRICGVRFSSAAQLQARAGTGVSGIVGIPAEPRPIVRQDFTVGRFAAPVADTANGPAVLRGMVRTSNGRPIPGAHVEVGRMRAAESGSDGQFTITDLPVGTQWLRVLVVGNAPTQLAVDLKRRDTTSTVVELHPVVMLDTLAVRGQTRATNEMAEFQFRRELGLGTILDEAEIKRHPTVRSLFLAIPSVTVTGRSDREFGVAFGRCGANLFVDGVQSDFEELASYEVSEITGIEVYPGQIDAPPRFQSIANRCGVVLVWTKRMR